MQVPFWIKGRDQDRRQLPKCRFLKEKKDTPAPTEPPSGNAGQSEADPGGNLPQD